jgi:hypothetical protein
MTDGLRKITDHEFIDFVGALNVPNVIQPNKILVQKCCIACGKALVRYESVLQSQSQNGS